MEVYLLYLELKKNNMNNQLKIELEIDRQFHLLKHFYYLDEKYINIIKDSISKSNINIQLSVNSSKFFKSFATTPFVLIEKITEKLNTLEINEGKNEFTFIFNEITGFDLLTDNKTNKINYFITRKLNVVLDKKDNEIFIITAYPGKYAPALPNKEVMDYDNFHLSNEFWENHKLGNFSKFEIAENTIIKINKTINEAWSLRYQDYDKALLLLEQAKIEAKEIEYIEGEKYAEFCIVSVQLLKTTAKEETFSYLINFLEYIYTTNNKLASVRCLSTLAKQYDLFGMYSKGIDACIKGIKLAEDNNYLSELSDLNSTFGFINIRISDFAQAEKSFEKSLEIRKTLQNIASIAASYNQLARANMLNKKYEKAEEYYLKSIKIREENKFYSALLWSYIGIASLYMTIKDYNKTLQYFKKIEKLKTEHNVNDKLSTIMCLHGEGQIKNNLEKFEDAKIPLIKSLQIAEDVGIKPIQYQIHLELYKSHKNLKNNEKALYHFEKYQEIKEIVLNEENSNKLKQQQISFAVEKSEKEAEIERLKNVELRKANDEITKHKKEIEKIHKEISDSINYAQKIQETVLPTIDILKKHLNDFFILFKPKDKVSGDFYWWTNVGNHTIITAVDCTGHGVPGAFMSMLGISLLNEIVIKEKIINPAEILSRLRTQIIKALKQTGEAGTQKDGMDMAIISINHETNTLQFSGANNPLYIIKKNKKKGESSLLKNDAVKTFALPTLPFTLYEVKPNKMPIAIYEKMDNFTTHDLPLEKNDQIYMFSDGYADQFGGPKGKKINYKHFKNLLLENINKPMIEQQKQLNLAFENWKGSVEQIDDVVVLGIKI